MSVTRKILVEGPTRGVTNAISAYVKDILYSSKSKRGSNQVQVSDPLSELAEGVERVGPVLLKWGVIFGGIFLFLKWILGEVGNSGPGLGGGGRCRCIQWVCE